MEYIVFIKGWDPTPTILCLAYTMHIKIGYPSFHTMKNDDENVMTIVIMMMSMIKLI